MDSRDEEKAVPVPQDRHALATPLLLFAMLLALYEPSFIAARPRGAWEALYLQLLVLTQCLALFAGLAVALRLARKPSRAWVARLTAGLAFLIPTLLYVDLVIAQRADRHLGSLARVLLDPSLEGNCALLSAMGIDGKRLVVAFVGLALIPLAGARIDRAADRLDDVIARHAPRLSSSSLRSLVVLFIAASLVLNVLGLGVAHLVRQSSWATFQRGMPPLLNVLGPAEHAKTSFHARLKPPRTEAELSAALAALTPKATPLAGDIVLFVADSLRGDAVDPIATPALDAFRRDAIHIDTSISGGNATHVGLYSLFRADPAIRWRPTPDGQGAVPLRIAKQRGYRIEVLSSPDLSFLGIDRMIFGPNLALADRLEDGRTASGDVAARDTRVVDELTRRVRIPHAPTVYLLFLDSTHLPYSWPDGFAPRFEPYADASQYFHLQRSPVERQRVFNRYKNAVAFVDTLFARVVGVLREEGRYDETSVVALGDHGEEFWESGLAGHGSDLTNAQTRTTLLLKLPSGKARPEQAAARHLATTVDVWPTLLEATGADSVPSGTFDGESMLHSSRHAVACASVDMWGMGPARFSIEDDELKLVFQLTDPEHPYLPQRVDVVEALGPGDVPVDRDVTASSYIELTRRHFETELSRMFDKLRW